MNESITVEKRTHQLWAEWQKIKDANILKDWHGSDFLRAPIIGEFQYLYRSTKGEISLIELPNYFHNGITLWEIYQIGGHSLFEDIERYDSKEEAEVRIEELLT